MCLKKSLSKVRITHTYTHTFLSSKSRKINATNFEVQQVYFNKRKTRIRNKNSIYQQTDTKEKKTKFISMDSTKLFIVHKLDFI